jgi:hypothetical protein
VVTKPQRKRAHLTLLSFRYRRWLLSGRPAALWYLERDRVTALWREYGDLIVARHVARWPFSLRQIGGVSMRLNGSAKATRSANISSGINCYCHPRSDVGRARHRGGKKAGLAMKINTIDPARA